MNISEDRLFDVVHELLPAFMKHKYVFLNGELGAGKTTFVKEVAKIFGIDSQVSSPTFSIINSYSSDKVFIVHSDLYRLESAVELENTGYFELIEDADIIFTEWADKFSLKDLFKSYCEVIIIKEADGTRSYKILKKDM